MVIYLAYNHHKKVKMRKSQGSCSHKTSELSYDLHPSFSSLPDLPNTPAAPALFRDQKCLSFLSDSFDVNLHETSLDNEEKLEFRQGSSGWDKCKYILSKIN